MEIITSVMAYIIILTAIWVLFIGIGTVISWKGSLTLSYWIAILMVPIMAVVVTSVTVDWIIFTTASIGVMASGINIGCKMRRL